MQNDSTPKPPQKRGFALLTPEHRKAIAAAGGRAVPPHKRAFSVNNELAERAGILGGQASWKRYQNRTKPK